MPIPSGSAEQGTLPFIGLDDELSALCDEVVRLRAETARLLRLLELTPQQERPPGPVQIGVFDGESGPVHAGSPAAAKVAFFASLLAARADAYAVRWENARTRRAGWAPAVRGGGHKGVPAAERQYLPLTEEVITAHLSGELELGLYPLLDGDRCHWLAADFDGPTAILDALAYLKAARAVGHPRRWRCPAPAWARTSGCSSPRRPRGHRPAARHRAAARGDCRAREDGPGQLRPALPLTGHRPGRRLRQPDRGPAAGPRSASRSHGLPGPGHTGAARLGQVPVGSDVDRLRSPTSTKISVQPPAVVRARLGPTITVEATDLPPALLATLKHAASRPNPVFYERQRRRASTWASRLPAQLRRNAHRRPPPAPRPARPADRTRRAGRQPPEARR